MAGSCQCSYKRKRTAAAKEAEAKALGGPLRHNPDIVKVLLKFGSIFKVVLWVAWRRTSVYVSLPGCVTLFRCAEDNKEPHKISFSEMEVMRRPAI